MSSPNHNLRYALIAVALAACSAGEESVLDPGAADSAVRTDVTSARDGAPSDARTTVDVARSDGAASDGASDAAGGDGATGRDPCGNGIDDDQNGMVDDGCPCIPGTDQQCYPRAAAEVGRGPCARGRQGCEGDGEFGHWTECVGAVVPVAEDCRDGVDNDCNGMVDDGASCRCMPGASEPCYTGPRGTVGVGICRAGHHECNASGSDFGTCLDEVLPRAELCSNRIDDDCDGLVDNGAACMCAAGTNRECYPGPREEIGRGICRSGRQTCNAGGTAWGACEGAIGPATEVCGNGLDDDCDGNPDDGCPPRRDCMVTVDLRGDCLTARCPAECPYPVGCMIHMDGDDPRGCVASRADNPVVYFQEGNACGAGRVTGTLSCSSVRTTGLSAGNCVINKPTRYYPPDRSGCPAT